MGRLAGKVALITGGSRGMGAETAKAMVSEGAKVLIADVLVDDGEALAKELGDACEFIKLDVTSAEQWDEAVAKANSMGKFNVLVNNAGILFHKTIMDTSEEDFMKIVSINQLGVFLGMKAVFESFKANDGGSIINLSSIDGLQSKNSLCAYSGTKWAVRGMTKSAAIEMGKYKIRVNSVHPGGIFTAMHANDLMTREQADGMYTTQCLKRVGMPEEVAGTMVFLASDESSYSTGAEFKVDGGWDAGLEMPFLPTL